MADPERDGETRPMISSGVQEARASAPPSFAVGDRVAGRYLICGLLGSGGMGEVYEVEDEQLHERVALKSIRPDNLADGGAAERFKQEIRLARKVTHPAVCRVFDLGNQAVAGQPDLLFLTMEILRGESLLARIQRGAVPLAEAEEIAPQIAAGLGAAHRAGIIHRDLKSSNVMLVGAARPWRAVITDFGLAGERTTNAAGEAMAGTPAYMAPEQVEGSPLSPATDLYALGCVLFELVTGRVPFIGSNPWETALLRLKQPPPSPRGLRPDLPPTWERAILACLQRLPMARPPTAEAVLALIQARPHRPAVPRLTVAAVAAAGLLAGAAWLVRRTHPGGGAAPAPVPGHRRSVAVLPFREPSGIGEHPGLGTAIAEMLSSELSGGDQLRLASGDSVGTTFNELHLSGGEVLAGEPLARVRDQLGVDDVVLGEVRRAGEGSGQRLEVTLSLQDSRSGERLLTLSDAAPEGQVGEALSRLAEKVRQGLGVPTLTLAQREAASGPGQTVLPRTPAAREAYFEAEAAYHRYDLLAARERLLQAIGAEPEHALTHALLSQVLTQLLDEDGARREAGRALELSSGLPREQMLLIKARKHAASTEWPQAVATYRSLFDFFPDNLEYGLSLARAQGNAGQFSEALSTLATLRQLPAPQGQNPGIDLVASVVLTSQGKADLAMPLLSDVIARAKAGRQTSMEIEALTDKADGEQFLNRPADAVASSDLAASLARELGDRASEAGALREKSIAQIGEGQIPTAIESSRQVLAMARELRSENLEAFALNDLGWSLGALGQFDEAASAATSSMVLLRKLHRTEVTFAEVLRGMIARWRGHLAEAQQIQEGVLEEVRSTPEESGLTGGWAQYELGLTLFKRNRLPESQAALQRSLEIRKAMKAPIFVSESLTALAELALAEGRASDAGALSGLAVQGLSDAGERLRTAVFFAVRSRALLALGDLPGAQAAAIEAVARSGPSPTILGWSAALSKLEVEARARGVTPPLLASLEALQELESQMGFQLDALDSAALAWRLRAARGADRLALIKQARAIGYERLAAALEQTASR